MRTTNNHFFSWDSLTIYDGASSTSSKMGKYCGDSIPPSHISSSNKILIHFKTDHYDGKNNGFKMEYNPKGKQITSVKRSLKTVCSFLITNFDCKRDSSIRSFHHEYWNP